MKSLVEIYHEVHFASDCFTDSLDRREVIGETLTAKTQLQTLETPSSRNLTASLATPAGDLSQRPLLL
jgi:hypothetical protein